MTGLTGNNILAGSSGQGGYEIEQSLRFEDGDSAYLEKTFSGVGTGSGSRWTFSCFVKRGNIGSEQVLIGAGVSSSGRAIVYFDSSDKLVLQIIDSGITRSHLVTSQVFRDVGSWYHIVAVQAEPDATSTDRVRLYVNGSRLTDFTTETYSSFSAGSYIPNAWTHRIGSLPYSVSSLFDGYLAEIHLIAGQSLDPSYFGETNEDTNQWIPKKYVGTYGTNGFYLNFSDSASLGADSSGNGNNFTPTNLAATDQVLDSPTNNFATLNYLGISDYNKWTFTEGNLKAYSASDGFGEANFYLNSGKWYFEVDHTNNGGKNGFIVALVGNDDNYVSGSFDVRILNSVAVGLYGVSIDMDTGGWSTTLNGSALSSGSFTSQECKIAFVNGNTANSKDFVVNFGQDSSFAGARTAQGNTDGNGKGDFYYAPPSGYLALCENNLSDPSIALPGEHFNTLLYTGLYGTSDSYTGVGFQPDFTWLKHRDNPTAYSHQLYDSVRGATNYLISNTNAAENDGGASFTLGLKSFDSDGFTLGQTLTINASGVNHASWNWKANGSGSSNTDGTITSTVSANTTAGFSIVSYAGNSTNGATVGHGLSQEPELIIYKDRDDVYNWYVNSTKLTGKDYVLILNGTGAQSNPGGWVGFTWNSSVITFPSTGYYGAFNLSGDNYIAYCFHSVEGYSKFGSYTGNGSTDGPFIYTGFRPAFLITKRIDSASDWQIMDSARDTYNEVTKRLKANGTDTETTPGLQKDFVSNGFKIRHNQVAMNANGATYIYMAFAESPFKYSNAR